VLVVVVLLLLLVLVLFTSIITDSFSASASTCNSTSASIDATALAAIGSISKTTNATHIITNTTTTTHCMKKCGILIFFFTWSNSYDLLFDAIFLLSHYAHRIRHVFLTQLPVQNAQKPVASSLRLFFIFVIPLWLFDFFPKQRLSLRGSGGLYPFPMVISRRPRSETEPPATPNSVKIDAPATWFHGTLCFTGQIGIPFFARAFFGDHYRSFGS